MLGCSKRNFPFDLTDDLAALGIDRKRGKRHEWRKKIDMDYFIKY